MFPNLVQLHMVYKYNKQIKITIKNSCSLLFQANFLMRVSRTDQDRCFKKHSPLELFIDH